MLNSKLVLDHSGTHQDQLYVLALALATSIQKMLNDKGGIYLSAEPELWQKPIVEFGKRMRVDGLEKFDDRVAISVIQLYRSTETMRANKILGTIIVYIPVSYIARLLKLLEYPLIDEDEESLVLDACGTIVNLIGGAFVKDLAVVGYGYLQMSHFESYINSVLDGIPFAVGEQAKYEIAFEINCQKRLVVEFVMGEI